MPVDRTDVDILSAPGKDVTPDTSRDSSDL